MLETDRLILRRWRKSDVAPFAAINADPAVMEFLGPLKSTEESQQMIRNMDSGFDVNGFGLWAAELKETQELAGLIGCWVPSFKAHFTPCIEVAWRLARAQWGKGLAVEGARAVITDIFSRFEIDELVSFTCALNTRSISVMKKLGMRNNPRDNYDHPQLAADNPLRPHVLYRQKKNEWRF